MEKILYFFNSIIIVISLILGTYFFILGLADVINKKFNTRNVRDGIFLIIIYVILILINYQANKPQIINGIYKYYLEIAIFIPSIIFLLIFILNKLSKNEKVNILFAFKFIFIGILLGFSILTPLGSFFFFVGKVINDFSESIIKGIFFTFLYIFIFVVILGICITIINSIISFSRKETLEFSSFYAILFIFYVIILYFIHYDFILIFLVLIPIGISLGVFQFLLGKFLSGLLLLINAIALTRYLLSNGEYHFKFYTFDIISSFFEFFMFEGEVIKYIVTSIIHGYAFYLTWKDGNFDFINSILETISKYFNNNN